MESFAFQARIKCKLLRRTGRMVGIGKQGRNKKRASQGKKDYGLVSGLCTGVLMAGSTAY
jgi:hypothetical protein